jgi:hypothetical protein
MHFQALEALQVLRVEHRGELPKPIVPVVALAFRRGELGVQVPAAPCRCSRGRKLRRSLFKGTVGMVR